MTIITITCYLPIEYENIFKDMFIHCNDYILHDFFERLNEMSKLYLSATREWG